MLYFKEQKAGQREQAYLLNTSRHFANAVTARGNPNIAHSGRPRKFSRGRLCNRDIFMTDEVILQILSRVGKSVRFHYQEQELPRKGYLKDRAVTRANPDETGVPYWDVVDLIHFPNEPEQEQEWIRIGYYRKPHDRLVWASQTTITEPVSTCRKLLVHAAKEKPWFRKLLDDVMAELQKNA